MEFSGRRVPPAAANAVECGGCAARSSGREHDGRQVVAAAGVGAERGSRAAALAGS
jgi:hypothetical protein